MIKCVQVVAKREMRSMEVEVPLYETVWCPKTGLPKPVHRSTVAATVLLRGDRWHVHSLIVEMGYIAVFFLICILICIPTFG